MAGFGTSDANAPVHGGVRPSVQSAGPPGSVRLGLFDPGHDIRPQWHTFVNYACEWEPIPDDGLERYPEAKPR